MAELVARPRRRPLRLRNWPRIMPLRTPICMRAEITCYTSLRSYKTHSTSQPGSQLLRLSCVVGMTVYRLKSHYHSPPPPLTRLVSGRHDRRHPLATQFFKGHFMFPK